MAYSIFAILVLSTILALMCKSELRLVSFTLLTQYLISEIVFKYLGFRGDLMMATFCFIDFTALLVIGKISKCANGAKIILSSIIFCMIAIHAMAYFNFITTLESYFLYLNILSGLVALFVFFGGVLTWFDDLVSDRHNHNRKPNRGISYSIRHDRKVKK